MLFISSSSDTRRQTAVSEKACVVFLSGVREFGGTHTHMRLVVCEARSFYSRGRKILKVLNIKWSGKHPDLRQNK